MFTTKLYCENTIAKYRFGIVPFMTRFKLVMMARKSQRNWSTAWTTRFPATLWTRMIKRTTFGDF